MGNDAYQAALGMLARREHSCFQINKKLQQKGFAAELIKAAITKLCADGSLDDARFAEIYTRSLKAKGYGPLRIQHALKESGIKADLIDENIESQAYDWKQHAIQVREKRFGVKLPNTPAEKARQARFMQYRGFSFATIKDALKFSTEMCDE